MSVTVYCDVCMAFSKSGCDVFVYTVRCTWQVETVLSHILYVVKLLDTGHYAPPPTADTDY